MGRRWPCWVAVAVLCLVALGCPDEEGAKNSLTLLNDTEYTIESLYIAQAGGGTWGVNQLAGPLAPDEALTILDIPSDVYDIRACIGTQKGLHDVSYLDVVFVGDTHYDWTLYPDPDEDRPRRQKQPAIADWLVLRDATALMPDDVPQASYVSPSGTPTADE